MTDTISIAYAGAKSDSDVAFFYYIRLGALLQFIENNLIYWIQVDSIGSPMLKFDTEVESNLMYIENDLQISVDPNICVINRTLILDGNEYSFIPDDQKAEPFESPLFSSSDYGQIMNIYVNMKWILLKLDELKDKNANKVALIDFLNNIFSSINSALGGVSALETTIDENTNTVIIRDKNPIPNIDSKVIPILNSKLNRNIPNKYVLFDLYGYKENGANSHASFIKDFNFTTEISPQLSTMLTVGATANSTVVGENSTAFSRFNFGLTDRFKKEIKTSKEEKDKVLNADIEEKKILWDKYSTTLRNYIAFLKRLSNKGEIPVLGKTGLNIYNNEGDTYKDTLTNLIIYKQQYENAIQNTAKLKNSQLKHSFLPGTGFIPFNMSLTMDGLSGMKIYNKFYLDTEYLPTNYPENAEFLIKNISHKIENNKWFTTVESIVTVKGEYKNKNKNIITNGSTTPSTKSNNNYPVADTINYSNIKFSNIGLGDPANDKINPDLLQDINKAAAASNVTVTITTAVSGHNTSPSTRHTSGNAVDISIIDGIAVRPNASNRAKIDNFVKALQVLKYTKNTEFGNSKAVLTFGFPGHDDHIHVSLK